MLYLLNISMLALTVEVVPEPNLLKITHRSVLVPLLGSIVGSLVKEDAVFVSMLAC